MVRVKKGLTKHRRHKRILTQTKGYRGAKSRLVRTAKEALMHAGDYAVTGRKLRKRDKRSLWITQTNAAVKAEGFSYSGFLKGLSQAKIELNRKILADLAISEPAVFKQILSKL